MEKRQSRTEQIKSYLERLGKGESLESVRKDFVREFQEVDASEIMEAEQTLLREGTPLEEVQKLCDVHSALFHGATREERIANAEKAVEESVKTGMTGHPLYTFKRENEALEEILQKCEAAVEGGAVDRELFQKLKEVAIHYAKKGDLLYPHLKVQYGISGPSAVMWTVDDEIRDELNALGKKEKQDEEWQKRFAAVLVRIREMIYKEERILFPNCVRNFTTEEWYGIYRDSKDYAVCLGVENAVWEEAENFLNAGRVGMFAGRQEGSDAGKGVSGNGQGLDAGIRMSGSGKAVSDPQTEIYMAGGHMSIEQLTAMLNTIPLEISFVDAENRNRFFNEGPKVFKRPGMAIDREVFSCHPPKIEQQVRRIIGEFRQGTLDSVPVWMDKNGRTMLVTYMAVRDRQNRYLGTLELVQDMEFAKERFQGR